MSFFDEYKDIGGGEYVGADEKNALIDNGIPIQITDVVYQEESKYGERYVCRVMLPDEESGEHTDERLMSFSAGTVESRDRMLEAMMKWLEDGDNEPPWVKLEKVGRAVIIVKGEAPEKPKARSRSRAK